MKPLLIILMALTLTAKETDCCKLLKRSINDLNKANASKRIDRVTMYSIRSLANSKLYSICIEAHEDYSVDRIIKLLKGIK